MVTLNKCVSLCLEFSKGIKVKEIPHASDRSSDDENPKKRKKKLKLFAKNEPGDDDDSPERNKKSVFHTMRQKMKSEREILTEHINVVQQDVADIEELLEGINLFDDVKEVETEEKVVSPEDEKKQRTRKLAKERKIAKEEENKKMTKIMTKIYGKLEKDELDELIKEEQVPYKPITSVGSKHIALMKEAMLEHVSEKTEEEDFDALMKRRLAKTKSNLGILAPDGDTSEESLETKASTVHLGNVVKSLTHFFEEKLHPNNNNSSLKEKPDTTKRRDSSAHLLLDYKGRKEICFKCCELCGNRSCIYVCKNYFQHFLDQQQMVKRTNAHSKAAVRAYLKTSFIANRHVTDLELMDISQSRE